jgi:shikimate kinase
VFRAIETRLSDELRAAEHTVFAPGGGWVTTPAALDDLPAGTALVWLRVSAEEAVRRATAGGIERPLLAGPDPLERARALLQEREALYRRADIVTDVDGRVPDDVARDIAARLAKEQLQA